MRRGERARRVHHTLPHLGAPSSCCQAVAMHDPAASVLSLPSGGGPIARLRTELASVESQETVLAGMLLSHAHRDLCLLGPGGVGKSVLVRQLAAFLGYSPINVMLYKVGGICSCEGTRCTVIDGEKWLRRAVNRFSSVFFFFPLLASTRTCLPVTCCNRGTRCPMATPRGGTVPWLLLHSTAGTQDSNLRNATTSVCLFCQPA